MKNLKILLVIFATFSLGLSNNVFGGGYAASSGIQYVQNIITQFTNQTNMRIIDPNNELAPNIDYVNAVLKELYAKGFNWNLSESTIKSQIAQAIWNALLPTINNYATHLPKYSSNQAAYKTAVWNSLNAILSELINTTFKDINQRAQAAKTPAARPVPAQQQPQQQPAAQQSQMPATALSDIRNGSFGNDYAKKVKEIVEFDYSQAKQIGFADLRIILEQRVNQTNSTTLRPASKMENIKKTIDSLYEDLSKYRDLKPTTSPVASAPSMVFTLDLILKGALGGAYAKKAKEINSFDYSQAIQVGFSPLSGVLQQDIAKINADKSPQSTKVANLKKSIDRLHEDLNKVYRDIKPAEPTAAPVGVSAKQPLPNWISNDNTLKNKEFETALLNYIFKNQDASEKDIQNYFSQQVPKNLPKRSNLINAMNKSIKNNFGDAQKRASRKSIVPPTSTTTSTSTATPKTTTTTAKPRTSTVPNQQRFSQVMKNLPNWINQESFEIDKNKFKIALIAYTKNNRNAKKEDIIKHFGDQIPAAMPYYVKDLLINDHLPAALDEFYYIVQSTGTSSSTSTITPKTTTTTTAAKTRASTRIPSQEWSSQLLSQLPEWVNKNSFEIDQNKFNRAVSKYVISNTDADDEDIVKHFSDQIPAGMAKGVKTGLINGIQSALIEFDQQAASSTPKATSKTTTTKTRVSTPITTTTRTSSRVPSQRLSLSSQQLNQLPEWIDQDTLEIDQNKFNIALGKYVEKNIHAENEDIIKHFSDQIPSTIVFKAVLIEDIKSALDEFYNQ